MLWYVRLRKAAKGATPFKILEVEEAIQQKSLQNAVMKAKRADVEGFEHYLGTDED